MAPASHGAHGALKAAILQLTRCKICCCFMCLHVAMVSTRCASASLGIADDGGEGVKGGVLTANQDL
jgi:hypothetical protein